jgi:sorbose reductase
LLYLTRNLKTFYLIGDLLQEDSILTVIDSASSVLDLFHLDGKKALVTGGSQGIGRGYVLALAGAGADVAIVDINERTGKSTMNEVESLGRESIFIHCNVMARDQVSDMIETIVEEFGRLDIGVNNAGIYIEGEEEDYSMDDWERVIAMNLNSIFACAQLEAKQMIKQGVGGKIINTASMSGIIANGTTSYNSAKAAVIHLTKSLAAKWGKYNINVNCISPSYIMSPMNAATPKDLRDRIRELHPMGYLQRPEDLYGSIVFLASSASDYITGINLLVDGGHTTNVWLEPLERVVPPRIDKEEEVIQLRHDLDVLGIEYDEDTTVPRERLDYLNQ